MRTLILFALLVHLTGCVVQIDKHRVNSRATAAYATHGGYSMAMNVLMSAGLVRSPDEAIVEDTPAGGAWHPDRGGVFLSRFCRNLPTLEDMPSATPYLAGLGFAAGGLTSPPTGIGLGTHMALEALGALASSSGKPDRCFPSRIHPLEVPLLIAWEQNSKNVLRYWTEAVQGAIGEINGDRLRLVSAVEVSGKRIESPFGFMVLDESCNGGVCKSPRCAYTAATWVFRDYLPREFKPVLHVWPVVKPPDFLGGDKPVLSVVATFPYELLLSLDKPGCLDGFRAQLLSAISKRLPNGYFLYLPLGALGTPNQPPLVLHNAGTLSFVDPLVAD